jgi:WD40 repeat protein
LKIATGCQDGLLRIFDTCQPNAAPSELKIVNASNDGIMKVSWMKDDSNTLLVGKKAGIIEKWDIRNDPTSGPVQSVNLETGLSVMDFDFHKDHNVLLTASGTKVR